MDDLRVLCKILSLQDMRTHVAGESGIAICYDFAVLLQNESPR